MSLLGKLSHKKKPRPAEFYKELQKKSVESRRRNKLSTGISIANGTQ